MMRCWIVFTLAAPGPALWAQDAVAGQQTEAHATTIGEALLALRQHQPQAALDILRKTLANDPQDAPADLLAASCAIELNQPAQAVTYGEAARALEPGNWKVRTTLVTAFAMAGKVRERDSERAALRALHSAGTVPEATQTSGFLLDEFDVKQYRLEAIEYFAPVGKFHIFYRFLILRQGRRVWQIDVQSDDYNQASWARTYPQQAAEGQRQFQVAGEGNGVRVDYRSFSGTPDYDMLRARIVEIVTAQTAPFAGER